MQAHRNKAEADRQTDRQTEKVLTRQKEKKTDKNEHTQPVMFVRVKLRKTEQS